MPEFTPWQVLATGIVAGHVSAFIFMLFASQFGVVFSGLRRASKEL